MKQEMLEIEQSIQVLRPVHEVYEAIVDPAKMSNYFIEKASGRMDELKEIDWKFPEFDESFPIRIDNVQKNKYIAYYWPGPEGKELLVELNLEPRENNSTLVKVTEKSMENNEAGIKWLRGNSGGWSNFLACLKAYMEYGINLRKGAFDYMRKEKFSK